jgi:DNA-binding NarL/FixJ family response regulator
LAIRIVLAEDDYLVREGVRRLLETQPDLEVVAACDDLPSLLQAVERERPDVVVTDIRMPPGHTDEGIRAAGHVRAAYPAIGLVVLSQFADPHYALALLADGSERRAYLLKERVDDLEQLAGAIREVVETLVAAGSRRERSPLESLTPREREVLAEVAQGGTNASIADALVITEQSVEKHIHSIFLKLGLTWQAEVNRRVMAVLMFLSEREP